MARPGQGLSRLTGGACFPLQVLHAGTPAPPLPRCQGHSQPLPWGYKTRVPRVRNPFDKGRFTAPHTELRRGTTLQGNHAKSPS